ncbi:tRNA preQ1(34) S-adenosylmethionine ribosyltransferase-isomerase QueA [Desulfopila sp. IMCC35008]|uniref:tRNA preQ1(34) S-adenosylmethionine ribosyltransferase-isomerase QueA n=1 Tax=Desulfopila sp. IMCC35008 TaxID=2653858 RepID=UPI0013D07A74|nr:tRNA preQ1(34) S-adenosylmethionine ribosyltransferase-isomerase QueA [Desulfopila sp. IMCC35008]
MNHDFSLKSYSYLLPEENIAQAPADKRENSRLMVLDTSANSLKHHRFGNIIDYFREGDVMVVNDTRVFPARLYGTKQTGGKVEVFLLNYPTVSNNAKGEAEATALLKSSKKPALDTNVTINQDLSITVLEYLKDGKVRIRLNYSYLLDLNTILQECGQVPLPPYISRVNGTTPEDSKRYQTVYADRPGAVAAPTAGLHFTDTLLDRLKEKGVQITSVTLHVGYGTFAPVRHETITDHNIHKEYISVPDSTVQTINEAKERGGRIWAIGTTSVRALEYSGRNGTLQSVDGWCDLYIYPGFEFRIIDNLITNFHLPESSLLFLVSALCGREKLLECYNLAIREGYRFYSYGDAMAVITRP